MQEHESASTITLGGVEGGAPGPSAGPEATLLFRGSFGSTVAQLPPGSWAIAGRRTPATILLDDRTVSSQHARIAFEPPWVIVEDLASRNGLWLHGQRVVRARLGHGDELQLGEVRLVVHTVVSAQHRIAVAPAEGPMAQVRALAQRAARGRLPILILGESGTGKEVLARQLHDWSPRAAGPMRALNCGAIPASLLEATLFGHEKGAFTGAQQTTAGIFEAAHGGTLFLDEIGELPLTAQPALLRVLETQRVQRVGSTREQTVDVRVVAATHQDLNELVAAGRFRLDLFHRINAFTLELPPLRDRLDELEGFIDHFLSVAELPADAPRRLAPQTLELLRGWPWPGNLRELKNTLERAALVATGNRIEPLDLPVALQRLRHTPLPAPLSSPPSSPPESGARLSQPPSGRSSDAASLRGHLASYERELMVNALTETAGHRTKAAELLKMPLRTFMKRMKEYGL